MPESVQAHVQKAEALRKQGKYRASVEEWRTALKLAPGDRNLKHQLAISLFLTQDYKGILPELQQFLKAEPRSANLNFFVGDCLLETARINEAVPYLEAALKLDPKMLPAHVALGLCYVHMDQPKKAIPHLKMGLKLDRDGSLYYQLARAYRATGQPELAKEAMERYQALSHR
jgi:predicted Zn-dependent protease